MVVLTKASYSGLEYPISNFPTTFAKGKFLVLEYSILGQGIVNYRFMTLALRFKRVFI